MYTLKNEIKKANLTKEDKYYNESFCNIVFGYLSSKGIENLTKEDINILKENGYTIDDFK